MIPFTVRQCLFVFAHDRFLFCFVFFKFTNAIIIIFSLVASFLKIRGRGSPLPPSAIKCAPLLKHQGRFPWRP